MRFRYFDSGGNEVSLSTAAALAVKIDLGEVTETTLLYDAACDAWAPAGEQEIYHHILEHGAPGSDDAPGDTAGADAAGADEGSGEEDAGDLHEALAGLPDPSPSSRGSSGRAEDPPLEDFWGPAMSASGADADAVAEAFDLSLDLSGADPDPSAGDGKASSFGSDGNAGTVGKPGSEAAGKAGAAGKAAGKAAGEQGSKTTGEPARPERPAASTAELAADAPSTARAAGDGPSRRSARRRDDSLAALEAIAKEAAARMEREEEARRRGPGPTLGDRVAESARKGGQKTGEALKTGAAASARALSEGGKATAESLGAGIRALGTRARKAGPKIRRRIAALARGTGSGASGLVAVMRGAGRGIGAGVVAAVRGVGVVLGYAWRGVRTAFLAPFRGAAGVWRMLRPLRGRAARDARKAVGTGVRRARRAAFSPVTLGLGLFAVVFLFFTYGGGREAGEELWQATVGIARSVAAETKAAAEAAEETAAEVADRGTAGPEGVASDAGAAPDGAAGEPRPGTPTETGGEDAGAVGSSLASDSVLAADSRLAGDAVVAGDDSAVAAPGIDEALLAEFEREVTLASEGALQDMIAGMDSVETALQLPAAPPEEWLGGYYLSHASEFHDVRQYWARYRGYIRSVKAQDAVLYRRGLEARFADLGVPRERIARLTGLAERRFREGRLRRDSLYDAMADVAEAAVDLHDFLAENEASIAYDPVRPGRVSRAPVLEAYATTPEVKEEMDARLDRILGTMERVHGLRPVFTRELQDVLFSSLQAAAAVDTFRLGPRDVPPDSGAPPPAAPADSPPDSGGARPATSTSSGGRPPGG